MIDDKDICIAVVYTYYALALGEQTLDFVKPSIYKNYADTPKSVSDLVTNITTGDIEDDNGVNISEKIRKFMLFGRGGTKTNKKNKTKKVKNQKNKKSKNRKTKNKKPKK